MLLEPSGDMVLRFRDDLQYRPKADGYTVVSPNQVHHSGSQPHQKPLGDLIARGTMTYDEVIDALMAQGCDPMSAAASIKALFDDGMLDELDVVAEPSGHVPAAFAAV
jgi:hypothetical protein